VVTTGGGKVAWGHDESLDLGLGDTVFIGAGTQVEFASGGDGLVVYRSFVEVP
jgi:mannose-6-phosphate isomerase